MTEAAALRSAGLVLAGAIVLGTIGTVAAFAPAGTSTASVGAIRLLGGAITLLLAVPLLGGSWRRMPALLGRWPLWIMAIESAAYQLRFLEAVQRAGVGISSLIAVGAVPAFTGLVEWAVLRQRPSRRWAVATSLAVLGLALRSSGQFGPAGLIGILLAATAAFGVACYLVAAKSELDRGAHSVELPATAYSLGAIFLLPLLVMQPFQWLFTPRGLLVAAYLGVATMALGNVLPIKGMRGLDAAPAATLLLADPLTATILGVAVLGESLSPLSGLGLVLVLVGLTVQVRDTAAPSRRGEARLAPDADS